MWLNLIRVHAIHAMHAARVAVVVAIAWLVHAEHGRHVGRQAAADLASVPVARVQKHLPEAAAIGGPSAAVAGGRDLDRGVGQRVGGGRVEPAAARPRRPPASLALPGNPHYGHTPR